MDIINTPPYEDMQRMYTKYFSLGYLGKDITTKFALISLICYVTKQLGDKNPDVTHYIVIKKLVGENLTEDEIKGLAVVCSDFAYCCTQFPTFGLSGAEITSKIKEIISSKLPF